MCNVIPSSGGDGSWCKELLNAIMQSTPHLWSQHTIQCFPPVLAEFFTQVRFYIMSLFGRSLCIFMFSISESGTEREQAAPEEIRGRGISKMDIYDK